MYGNWAIEFGATTDGETANPWKINEEYPCQVKGGNIPAATETTYTDCTITLVVDYENVVVKVLIESEVTALEHTALSEPATKVIENGQLVIIKNGIRYNALGTAF